MIKLFEHGKTFGSLIRVPPELAAQLPAAQQSIEAMVVQGRLWEHRPASLLLPLIKQAELLARTYDAVVTPPSYMGNKFYNPLLKSFINQLGASNTTLLLTDPFAAVAAEKSREFRSPAGGGMPGHRGGIGGPTALRLRE